MKIQINGQQINIGDALRHNVETKINETVKKYSDKPIDAVVTFSREAHEFRCQSSVHISTGLTAQADANANDIHTAYEKCIDKIEKQLRRHKRRMKDHHRNESERSKLIELQARSYILDYKDDEEESDNDNNMQDAQPPIVAEITTDIRQLSVGAAVMHMEFQNVPVLLFQNELHGGINVVYKRDDGSVGWIDPNLKTKSATVA